MLNMFFDANPIVNERTEQLFTWIWLNSLLSALVQGNIAQNDLNPVIFCEQATNWFTTSLGHKYEIKKKFTPLTLECFKKIEFIVLKN